MSEDRAGSGLPRAVVTRLDSLFGGRPALRAIAEALIERGCAVGDVELHTTKASVDLKTYRRAFAIISTRTKDAVDLGLRLDISATGRLEDTGKRKVSDPFKVRIRLRGLDDVDDEVDRWLERAYRASC
jgi:hypothetical protein